MKRSENVGLCAKCRHSETVVSTRGSTFYLCRLSLTDPRFPKYPTLPVLACGGYEPSGEQVPERGR
jgi:hypothetical protein